MTNDYTLRRLALLDEELDLFSEMGIPPLKKMARVAASVRQAMVDLKANLLDHPFENQDAEIRFFKYGKPVVLSRQIYSTEIYTIESRKPSGDDVAIQKYYEGELYAIGRFFAQYQFLYQYYLFNSTELDHLLFIRGSAPETILIPESPGTDPEFSTAADYLFARFIAYQRVQEFLHRCLYEPGGTEPQFRLSKKGRTLAWTGDKTNLVELAYGLYHTRQINEGQADISDIIEWLEQTLQISLSRYYSRFTEMKMRKSVSKTRFLDEMRNTLNKYIEDGDALKSPVKKR